MFISYEQLVQEIGEPKPGESLHRKDEDDHYRTGNVKWANYQEQAEGRSTTISVEYLGEQMCLSRFIRECESELGISRHLVDRLRKQGLSAQLAIDRLIAERSPHSVRFIPHEFVEA